MSNLVLEFVKHRHGVPKLSKNKIVPQFVKYATNPSHRLFSSINVNAKPMWHCWTYLKAIYFVDYVADSDGLNCHLTIEIQQLLFLPQLSFIYSFFYRAPSPLTNTSSPQRLIVHPKFPILNPHWLFLFTHFYILLLLHKWMVMAIVQQLWKSWLLYSMSLSIESHRRKVDGRVEGGLMTCTRSWRQ